MNEFLTSITSFLAIWFNDFKKHVFKVQVVNDKQSDFSGVEKKIGAIVSSLNLLSAELSRSSSAQNNEYIKGMVKRIDVLLSLLKNNKDMNLSRLESSVDSLVKVMKRAEITGDVKVTNFPDKQKVEGDVKLSNMQDIIKGLQVVVDAINNLKIDLTHEVKGMGTTFMGMTGSKSAYKITDGSSNASLTTVSTKVGLDVNIIGGTVSVDTTGLATSAKQDTQITSLATLAGAVSGTEMQVDVITMPTTTVQATNLDIRDLTSVSDSVSAVQSGTWNITNISGTVSLPTGASTSANQSAMITSLQLLDDVVATTASAITAKGFAVSGTDGTNARVLKTDTSGELQVDVLSSALPTGAALDSTLTTIDGSIGTVITNTSYLAAAIETIGTTDVFKVALFNAADGQITDFATQTTLAAINAKLVSGTDIGDVTINNSTGAAAVNIQDGGNSITVDAPVGTPVFVRLSDGASAITTLPVSLASVPSHAVTNAGTFAVQVDGSALTALQLIDDIVYTDDTSTHSTGSSKGALMMAAATPTDGSVNANDIGALAMSLDRRMLSDVTLQIADADVSATNAVPTKGVPSDIDINGSNANHADKYYTNAGAVTDGIVWSPAAGKRWHVTTLYINVSAAATVTLEDDLAGGDVARWKGELAANSGVVLTYDKEHPFCSAEDAADLIITTSAGNVYVQAVGYEI